MNTKTLEVSTATQGETVNLLDVVRRAASDSSVDVAKMQQLLQMAKEMEAIRSKREYDEAMQCCQAEMPVIPRASINSQTNSRYAKLEVVIGVAKPVYSKYGFSVSFGSDSSPLPDHYRVTAKVSSKGHTEIHHVDIPADYLGPKGTPNKTKTHGFGSSMSYARRYLLMLIFNLSMQDDIDGNMRKPESPGPSSVAGAKQVDPLVRQIWDILKPVRGTEQNWNQANKWLWNHQILDAATEPPEAMPYLGEVKLKQIVAKLKNIQIE